MLKIMDKKIQDFNSRCIFASHFNLKTMKTTLLSFCMILGSACIALAQPTIAGSKFFIPGNTLTYAEGTTTTISPGSGGANQTWDFSMVTNSGFGYQNQYVAAAGTPYAASFPGSNVAITDPTSGVINYTYITNNSSSANFNGYVLDFNGSAVNFPYSNAQQYFTYPLAFNNSNTDTYSGSGSVTASGITMNSYRNGTITSTVDGWGTVITPSGTYPNCLRVHIRDVYRDSLVYVGLPVPAEITENYDNTYIYIDGSGTLAVDRAQVHQDTTIDASGTTTDESIYYLVTVTTGVSSVRAASLNLYPNPAADNIFITPSAQLKGDAVIRILDMSGRTVAEISVEFAAGVPVSIPVKELQSGSYILRAEAEGSVYTGRFVRQ